LAPDVQRNRFFLFIALYSFLSLVSGTGAQEDKLRAQLEKSGHERRVAIWYVYQENRTDLVKPAAEILLTSDDPADQKAVIAMLEAFGDQMDAALPIWYLYLDKYMTYDREEDLLIRCMDLAAKWKEHRLMSALGRMAQHPMRRVRNHAFQSMAVMRNDQVIPIILRLSQSGRAIERMYSLEGMRAVGDSRLVPFAERLLQDPNRSVRMFAIPGFAAQPGSDANSYAVTRMFMQESDEEIRERIIDVIVQKKWGQHSNLVAQGCSDPSALVRQRSFMGAKVFGLSPSVSRQLEDETEKPLRALGMEVLLALGNSGGGTGLAHILSSEEDPLFRLRAASLLALFKERNGLSALHYSVRSDPSEEVRIEAADALGEIGDNSSISVLYQVLADDAELYTVKSAALMSYLRFAYADKKGGLIALAGRARDVRFAKQLRRTAELNGR
jgi:hypothetical protein